MALEIADEEGLEEVSIRRIARELRSGAMSLYHYFDSPRRAARADGRHGRGRDARARAAAPTGARRCEAIAAPQPRDVPATTRGCCRRCRSARASARTCCATSSSPRSRWPSSAGRRRRRSCSSGIVTAVDDYTIGYTLRELAAGGSDERGRRIATQFRAPTTSRNVRYLLESGEFPMLAQFVAPAASRRDAELRDRARLAAGRLRGAAAPITSFADGHRVRREGPPHPRLSGRRRLRLGGADRQARLQRVAVSADPGRDRGGHEGADRPQPLPGPDERGAAAQAVATATACPRSGSRSATARATSCSRPATRCSSRAPSSSTRGRRSQRLPAPGGGVRRARDRGAARRRALPPARQDGRGDHRAPRGW